jgi:hypothetical protein
MYIVKTYITLQQIPTDDYPNRTDLLLIPHIVSFDGNSSWENLTSTFRLTLSRKSFFVSMKDGKKYKVFKDDRTDSNIGGNVGEVTPINPPIIMSGDVLTVQSGYQTILNGTDGKNITYLTGYKDPTGLYDTVPDLFKGYVSNVDSGTPFVINCEDAMWLMKQVPSPITSTRWTGKNLQEIVQAILDDAQSLPQIKKYNTVFTISKESLTDLVFNVGNFMTKGESLAEVLQRMKQQYRVDSYFRGNELRIGITHYLPKDNKEHTLTFQKNIIDNQVKYQRKDDVTMSAIVQSHYDEITGRTNAEGAEVSVRRNTEILIYVDPKTRQFTYKEKKKGEPYFKTNTLDVSGERINLQLFALETDPEKLFQYGKKMLEKTYYDGLRGTITTFGIPYIKHGDDVKLVDPIIRERNGTYKVRSVSYSFTTDGGLRQQIGLDYRSDIGG